MCEKHGGKVMDCIVSKSILERKKPILTEEEERNFCLGLPGWCLCHECSPTSEPTSMALSTAQAKGKKSLSLKRKREVPLFVTEDTGEPSKKIETQDNERFDFNVTSDDLSKFMEGETPANTEKSTTWAIKNFEEWRKCRNTKFPSDLCPKLNCLAEEDRSLICEWLCKFISETRKSNGEEYTPRSLYLILAGIQRHLRKVRQLDPINIFEDPQFKTLKNVCDSIFKRLHRKGIGTETKATAVLSQCDEDTLWDKKVLDVDTPKGLLRAVFFYNGKNFCLRGGQEQRNLRLSQLKRDTSYIDGKEVSSYVYEEFGSKNRQGGFGSLNLHNKIVRQHQSSSNPDRCHVRILDKYLRLLPPEAKDQDNFYLTPLPKKPMDPLKPWYTKTPIGRNRLNVMLKEMCQEAGICGNFSNHSLRAYGASSMFQAGVPEKLIQQRTGHRTLEALRQYE